MICCIKYYEIRYVFLVLELKYITFALQNSKVIMHDILFEKSELILTEINGTQRNMGKEFTMIRLQYNQPMFIVYLSIKGFQLHLK